MPSDRELDQLDAFQPSPLRPGHWLHRPFGAIPFVTEMSEKGRARHLSPGWGFWLALGVWAVLVGALGTMIRHSRPLREAIGAYSLLGVIAVTVLLVAVHYFGAVGARRVPARHWQGPARPHLGTRPHHHKAGMQGFFAFLLIALFFLAVSALLLFGRYVFAGPANRPDDTLMGLVFLPVGLGFLALCIPAARKWSRAAAFRRAAARALSPTPDGEKN